MMKHFLYIILSAFLVWTLPSCQSTRQEGARAGFDDEGEEDLSLMDEEFEEGEDAGEAIGQAPDSDSLNTDEEDLESEFVDSEDFERDVLQGSAPREGEGTEEGSPVALAENEEGMDEVEDREDAPLEEEDIPPQESLMVETSPPPSGDEGEDLSAEFEEGETEVAGEDTLPESKMLASEGESGGESEEDPELKELKEEDLPGEGMAALQEQAPDSEQSPVSQDESSREGGDASQEVSVSADSDISAEESEEGMLRAVIDNIRYVAEENKIYIDGKGGELSHQSRENTSNNQFVMEISPATLSDRLKWPFVMKDFKTQMAFLKADQKDENTVRVIIQMRRPGVWPVVVTGDTPSSLVVSVQGSGEGLSSRGGTLSDPGSGGEGEMFSASQDQVLSSVTMEDYLTNRQSFTGKPINLHFRNIPLQYILYDIADRVGLNMVVDSDVQGSLSLKLRQVPWDRALVMILKTKGLRYMKDGNIIRIMTKSTFKAHQNEVKQIQAENRVMAPLKTEVIPLTYSKAGEMKARVSSHVGKTKRQGVSIFDDATTNSLIITDTQENLDKLKLFIRKMDQIPKQVMIEAKVVEATENFAERFGLNWGLAFTPLQDKPLFGKPDWGLNLGGRIDIFAADAGQGGRAGGSSINAPFRIGFAPVGDLDATLGISENEGVARVISSPRILVLNGKSADISQNSEIVQVRTSTQSAGGEGGGAAGGGNVDVGGVPQSEPVKEPLIFNFSVTPEITAVGSVFMKLKVKRDFAGPVVHEATLSRAKNTREVNTEVLVGNGQTIVVGGMYQNDSSTTSDGIPILKHIPILNWLFTKKLVNKDRNELLIFVTPRVLNRLSTVDTSSEEAGA